MRDQFRPRAPVKLSDNSPPPLYLDAAYRYLGDFVLRKSELELADSAVERGEELQGQGGGDGSITADVDVGQHDAAIALAPNDCADGLHLLGHVDLSHWCRRHLATVSWMCQ